MTHKATPASAAQRAQGFYEAIIDCDQVIIRSRDRKNLFPALCQHLVQASEVDTAWIGLMDRGDTQVWPQAHFGKNLSYTAFIESMVGMDAAMADNPVGQAIRAGQAVWHRDVHSSPDLAACAQRFLPHGWHSVGVLPLTTRGKPVGVLCVYATSVHTFDATARKLLSLLASNISHALDYFAHDDERRMAEATLAESEARCSALFANNCMPMLLINPENLRIVDANIRAINFYGWSQAELTSMHVPDINTLSSDEIRREMARARAQGKAFFNFKHRLANGEVRDVEVFSSPISFGGETYLLSAIHDVSERREVELNMKNMQTLVQQFIDELPGTAYLKDSQLRLVMANKHLGQTLGVDPKQLIGKTAHDIFPKDFADLITELDLQMLADGGRRTVTETYQGRHLENSMFVMQNAAGEKLLGGLSLDVTARYRASELTTVLLQINELGGVVPEREYLTRGLEMAQTLTHSEIGFLHFVNDDQETLELITWTAGALRGCTAAYDQHYPVSQAGIWADCVRERAPVMFNDYASYTRKRGLPDGHAPLLRLISVPVVEDGGVRMILGVGNKSIDYDDDDINTLSLIGNDLWRIARRARAEAQLQARVQELLALNQKLSSIQLQLLQSEKMASIGQLAAGVAHEINNPIGFVKSNLSTLSQYTEQLLALFKDYGALEAKLDAAAPGLLKPVQQRKAEMDFEFVLSDLPQLIKESRDGIDRVSRIVLDLKSFSRASDNEWQWTDLHAGIDSTINVVWNQLKYKVQVVREYGDLPQVFCVASQINQVVMNLLVNAEQAIATKGQITVRTGVQGEQVWIEVQDDGCGMDAATQARIFEPFFTTKPVGQGTGLGLSIAFDIIARHQGRLLLTSKPGQGSTFRVELPIDGHSHGLAPGESA